MADLSATEDDSAMGTLANIQNVLTLWLLRPLPRVSSQDLSDYSVPPQNLLDSIKRITDKTKEVHTELENYQRRARRYEFYSAWKFRMNNNSDGIFVKKPEQI